ncbi:MAG TPA: GNAT family N-acetyltransferase [Vicinamibacterales bacterium]|nr:GNAT family N-acetyltransferase [Vicinamibacterales bacterium]
MKAVLETERLLLRHVTIDDVDDLLGIFSDPETMRYYAATRDRVATIQWIDRIVKSYSEYGFGPWAVVRKDTAQFVGHCGVILQRDVAGCDELEIGYAVQREQWNLGFATEAAIGCRNFGFTDLDRRHLVSLIDPGNVASKRVAEKVGMSLEKEIDRWGKRIRVYGIAR